MKIEIIELKMEKLNFVQKLFAGRAKASRFALLAGICDIGRLSFEIAENKLVEMERQGYIVPVVEKNFEDYYELGGR